MVRAIHEFVARRVERGAGALPAVSQGDQTLTYDDLWAATQTAAVGLAAAGVRPGDRVGIYLDKRLETVVTILASSLAGAVFVPVNPVLKAKQVAHILGDCDVRVLVTTAERHDAVRQLEGATDSVETVVLVGAAKPGHTEADGTLAWADLAGTPGTAAATWTGRDPVDSDVGAIFYTSGSTGLPKGVVLTQRNLIVGAESVSSYLGNTSDDVILSALPLSFDAGFSQLTTAFAVGAHVVLLNYLVAADVVKACAKWQVTGLTCVPPLWIQLVAASWPAEATGALRYFANTGGRMPKSTLADLRALFPGAKPFLMYGLTEAFRSTYLDPDQVDARPDSIGKAIPNAEVLVVRPDGSICDDDEPGELVHRGPLVSLGYWNDPERTAERFKRAPGQLDGLPHVELAVWSGDTVRRDAQGFLYFVGREDEMIKTSGYRVSPAEIEEAAYDTGMVRDAVAFGAADEVLGQRVILVVALEQAGQDQSQAALTAELRRRLPLYMVPKQVVVLDTLPRSANGKFDRTAIRASVEV